jgi:hypothetical protein
MLRGANGGCVAVSRVLVLSMLLTTIGALASVAPAQAEAEPGGGLSSSQLWVHARLGQPSGSGSGGGPRSGWALRYERIQENATGCVVVPLAGSAALRPWFGQDGNPVVVRVVQVDRQTGAELGLPGSGCLNPQDIVQIPSQQEVIQALEQEGVPQPRITASPTNRGLTGLETWLWFDTTGHLEVNLVLRGFTVQATADATFHWSTGDDGNYETGSGGTPQNPAVRHVYNSKSPGSGYNVTLDMIWEGEYNWFGFGDAGAGQLGPVTRSGTRSYPVNEVRSVLQ